LSNTPCHPSVYDDDGWAAAEDIRRKVYKTSPARVLVGSRLLFLLLSLLSLLFI